MKCRPGSSRAAPARVARLVLAGRPPLVPSRARTGRRFAVARPAVTALAATLLLASVTGCAAAGQAGRVGATTSGSAGSAAGRYPLGLTVVPAGQRQPLPPLSGVTLTGAALAVSSLRGHLVVLNVWASWCAPCKTESPALVALARATTGSGVRFVGLDESDTPSAASAFLHRIGSPYPHLNDSDGALLARLSAWVPATAVPSTLVLDPQGRVAARVIGPVTAAQLRSVLAGLGGAR